MPLDKPPTRYEFYSTLIHRLSCKPEPLIMSDPTVPQDPPAVPDAPSPNQPVDVPDVGQPEPEPDQQGGADGK